MTEQKSVMIVGGTAGIGRHLAQKLAGRGDAVVISGRDSERAQAVAKEIGGQTRGVGFDLAEPEKIAERLGEIAEIDSLVLTAIERDSNTIHEFNVPGAIRSTTLKLVGYLETIHVLVPSLTQDASIILYGGQARVRPYPGSTTVSTANGGISGMMRSLALELAPIRVNALHLGIVGDSPAWSGKPEFLEMGIARTPTKRLATMDDCVDATMFLMENPGVNGIDLVVDGGWSLL